MSKSTNGFVETVTFFGGVGSVTGANFLFEIGPTQRPLKILVDCGLVQGEKTAEDINRDPFGYDVTSIDLLFITHAHLDHVGRIPKLVKEGFKGIIYSTPQTLELARLILADALGLLQREAHREGVEPLYEEQDVLKSFTLWRTIPYHTDFAINASINPAFDSSSGLSVYLKDAGHILGSSMYTFSWKSQSGLAGVSSSGASGASGQHTSQQKSIVFTGDLGNTPTPLLKDTEPVTGVNYIVMESVYGDRNHEPKDERRGKLEQVVLDTIKQNGTLLMPTFSLERTQVLLYELNKLVGEKRIPSVPIYVDSPLAIKVTEVYKNNTNLFNDGAQAYIHQHGDLFHFPHLSFTLTAEDSKEIDHTHAPKIILAGSGMSAGGRVVHHESIYLPEAKNTVLLVGYQSLGTLGRALEDGAKQVTIGGNKVPVHARIETILGYSSHKDSDHLVEFASTAGESLKRVFVVMGEPKASLFLAQKIRDNVGVDALYPAAKKQYFL